MLQKKYTSVKTNLTTSRGFTLVELLTVLVIISLLAALLLPALNRARNQARRVGCLSNLREIGVAASLYMADYNGGLFHHHEGWVLDDGTQVDQLPSSLAASVGGGMGTSEAEKPWVIYFQPYLRSRPVAFCPSDPTPRSKNLASTLSGYNDNAATPAQVPATSELGIAQRDHLTLESYALDSIFTHKSARYALEGALDGFATERALSILPNPNLILFSERNSEALNAPDNDTYGNTEQDDYDTWVGEPALVRWGNGKYGDQGWLRYNRHDKAANYTYTDGHAELLPWSKARGDQFPDHIVRQPLQNPPK
jgi:prepilin-type N-terminal cleavage/methylation domain-containing protein/prepilin-type processing-associated H-X9-DG protein